MKLLTRYSRFGDIPAPSLTYLDQAKVVGDFFQKGMSAGQTAVQLQQNQQKINNELSIAEMENATKRQGLALEAWANGERTRLGYAQMQNEMVMQQAKIAADIHLAEFNRNAELEKTKLQINAGIMEAQISHAAQMGELAIHQQQMGQVGVFGTSGVALMQSLKDGKVSLSDFDVAHANLLVNNPGALETHNGQAMNALLENARQKQAMLMQNADEQYRKKAESMGLDIPSPTKDIDANYKNSMAVAAMADKMTPVLSKTGVTALLGDKDKRYAGVIGQSLVKLTESGQLNLDGDGGKFSMNGGPTVESDRVLKNLTAAADNKMGQTSQVRNGLARNSVIQADSLAKKVDVAMKDPTMRDWLGSAAAASALDDTRKQVSNALADTKSGGLTESLRKAAFDKVAGYLDKSGLTGDRRALAESILTDHIALDLNSAAYYGRGSPSKDVMARVMQSTGTPKMGAGWAEKLRNHAKSLLGDVTSGMKAELGGESMDLYDALGGDERLRSIMERDGNWQAPTVVVPSASSQDKYVISR